MGARDNNVEGHDGGFVVFVLVVHSGLYDLNSWCRGQVWEGKLVIVEIVVYGGSEVVAAHPVWRDTSKPANGMAGSFVVMFVRV